MMEQQRPQLGWPLVAVLVALAAALGFGAAHWLSPRAATASAPIATPAAVAEPAAAGGAIEVKIPAEYLAAAKIAVEAVGSGGLASEILTSGTVAAAPNSEAVILARASGNVTRVRRQLGDVVRAGDTLAQVESPEAAAMAAERSVAQAKLELARKSFERESGLFKQGVTPRQDMEAAQAALSVAESEARRASAVAKAANVGADGKSVAVVSPIDGTITARAVTLGAFVQQQTELFRVAGAGQMLVEASLPVADIARVAVGDQATILAAGGTPVKASVRSVTPTVSGTSRSATVILTPSAPTSGLVVGEGVQARLHVKNGKAGLVVPEDAVQNIEGRDMLFVRVKDGFRAQPVLVGGRSGGAAQIASGVAAGEQVATRNAFLIKADMIKSEKAE